MEQKTAVNPSDGICLSYYINRPKNASKKMIILHPGSGANHTSLKILAELLNTEGHPTISLDPRGTGFSDTPESKESYSLAKFSEDIKAIIELESVEKPILLGHSFGFMVLSEYVAQTENASMIIGIGASHSFSKTTVNNALLHFITPMHDIIAKFINSIAKNRDICPDLSIKQKSDLMIWLSLMNAPKKRFNANLEWQKEMIKLDISEQLKKIKIPTLLVYGKEDFLVRPIAAEYIRKLVKGICKTILMEGFHSLPIKKPEAIAMAIKKEITSLKAQLGRETGTTAMPMQRL